MGFRFADLNKRIRSKKDLYIDSLLIPWLISRGLVLLALFAVRKITTNLAIDSGRVHLIVSAGLTSWDAGFYSQIAAHGYGSSFNSLLRFFPLYPLLGHLLSYGISTYGFNSENSARLSLLVLSNVAALFAGLVVYHLGVKATRNQAIGKRAVWIYFFAPASFVTTMAYPESLFCVFVGLYLLAILNNSLWVAATCGFCAGLTRPTGILLAFAGLTQCIVLLKTDKEIKSWLAKALIYIGSPIVGTVLYLTYSLVKYGKFFGPYSIQLASKHRGKFVNPVTNIYDKLIAAFHGHLDGVDHFVWILLVLILIVFYFRNIPISWNIYVIITFIVAIVSSNLDGFERYIVDAVPIVVLAAKAVESDSVFKPVLVILTGSMILYFVLSMFALYIP